MTTSQSGDIPCAGCGRTDRPITIWKGTNVCSEICRKKRDEDLQEFWLSDASPSMANSYAMRTERKELPKFEGDYAGVKVPGAFEFKQPDTLRSSGILEKCVPECSPHLHQFCSPECEAAWSAATELARAGRIPLAEALDIVVKALAFFFVVPEAEEPSSPPHNGEGRVLSIGEAYRTQWDFGRDGRPIRHRPCDVPLVDVTSLGDEVEWYECPACKGKTTGNRIGHEAGEH